MTLTLDLPDSEEMHGIMVADLRGTALRPPRGVLLGGGLGQLQPDFVVDTFTNTSPLLRTDPEEIEMIRAWGRERAVPAGRGSTALTGSGPQPVWTGP